MVEADMTTEMYMACPNSMANLCKTMKGKYIEHGAFHLANEGIRENIMSAENSENTVAGMAGRASETALMGTLALFESVVHSTEIEAHRMHSQCNFPETTMEDVHVGVKLMFARVHKVSGLLDDFIRAYQETALVTTVAIGHRLNTEVKVIIDKVSKTEAPAVVESKANSSPDDEECSVAVMSNRGHVRQTNQMKRRLQRLARLETMKKADEQAKAELAAELAKMQRKRAKQEAKEAHRRATAAPGDIGSWEGVD